MKLFRKCVAFVFIMSLLAVLCACGRGRGSRDFSAPDPSDEEVSTEDPSGAPDEGSAESGTDIGKEENTSEEAAAAEEEATPQDASDLLDVVFYAEKEEAEAAAGERLLSSYESDAVGDGRYNPDSWCYALVTAFHDGTEVEICRGYDGITQGDETAGFLPTDTECYERMDAGERIVVQVNVEWYPVFQIDVSDGDYKATLPLGWDIYTSKDEQGIPAPLKVTGQKIIHPIAIYREEHYINDEDALAHYPDYTYGSSVELFCADEDHPELAKRLDKMNAEALSEYEEGFGMLGLESAEEYASSGHDGTEYYYKNMRSSLCRADDTVLSFVQFRDTGMGSQGRTNAVGINLDTETGRDLTLDEVLKDMDDLPDAVYERCSTFGYEDEICEIYRDVTKQYIGDGDYLSSSYFSWNICYEGLWLHLNDSLPQEVLYRFSGLNSIFVPFRYYPELFEERYTNVPEAYCYDIETGPEFAEYYALELYKDGRYVDLVVREPEPADPYANEFITKLTVGINSVQTVITEGIFSMNLDTLAVHSASGRDYLYIQQTGGQDTAECAVYQLSYELYYEGTTVGSIEDLYADGDWYDHSNSINGRIMTDPSHFLMTRRDNRLGYGTIYAHHELARSGEPMKSDPAWTYAFNGNWELYPLQDMTVSVVDEDRKLSGEATLPANTLIRPYRTDCYSYIDVIDKQGNIYRIGTEKTRDNPTFVSPDGKDADELFGGISW